MIILGVDPGSVVTGYGVLETEGNRFKVVEAGPLRLKKHGELPNRLVYLAEHIERLIATHRPDVLAIEKIFHGVNFNSTLRLGYVRGVVLMLAARLGVPVAEYASTEVKKAVTGYGRAEKSQVQEMVRMLLGLNEIPKPNDVADALALAICHAHTAPVLDRYKKRTN